MRQRPCHNTPASGLRSKAAAAHARATAYPPRERENVMNRFEPIWTSDDFRRTVTLWRALGTPEFANAAPVIDIKTRQRIA